MASTEGRDDYYTILGVAHTATAEEIKTSYRKLAKTLHPDKNPNNPDATTSFQRLSEAYETLRNPRKRMEYDIKRLRVNNIQLTRQATENREAEAAENRRKSEAEKPKPENKDIENLTNLGNERASYRESIGEIRQRIIRNIGTLQDLQDQDDEALRQEARESSDAWFQNLHGAPKKPDQEQQKETRERERLQRVARRRIIDNEVEQDKAKLQILGDRLQDIMEKISAIKKRLDEDTQAQEMREEGQWGEEVEARARVREQQSRQRGERRADWGRQWREEAEARAGPREQQARQTRERWANWEAQILRAEEVTRQEAHTNAQAASQEHTRAGQGARWAQEIQDSFPSGWSNLPAGFAAASQRAGCRHEKFWPRVGGPHRCRNCQRMQTDFAFQCPGCQMIACTNCRKSLRDGRN
ncbi:hypothetical protein FQN54_003842 [Arachnomyces sp. PD_36]|nr:hypothetical protein FQN54_003842 [Arachnomyces sp. PD_36]